MTDFAMIAGVDQWLRMSHENTSVNVDDQTVHLAQQITPSVEDDHFHLSPCGIAFDPWCRLYQADPKHATLQRWQWPDRFSLKRPTSLFAPRSEVLGDFVASTPSKYIAGPQSIVIDTKGRLFIADTPSQRIVIFNVLDNNLVRTIDTHGRPVSLSIDKDQVFALIVTDQKRHTENSTDESDHINIQYSSVISFSAHSTHTHDRYKSTPLNTPIKSPSIEHLSDANSTRTPDIETWDQICVNEQQRVFVLCNAYTSNAFVWAIDGQSAPIRAPYASAIVAMPNDTIVIAKQANTDFLQYRVTTTTVAQMPSLQARYYNGRGIARDPNGRVAYFSLQAGVSTANAIKQNLTGGMLSATQTRSNYKTRGRIVCGRLDNQQMQGKWGRIFLDACLAQGTKLKLGFIVSDDSEFPTSMVATAPENISEFEILRPDLSPPLPSETAVSNTIVEQALHRRSQNRELPWSFTDDPWRTFEAPINAPPGRYLWLVIDLFGKFSTSPKIKSIRVEYPAMNMLRRLPRVFSEQGAASDFLHRYLSLANTNFDELNKRSDERHYLVDPMAAPTQMLPWIGDLVGMDIDKRWSSEAKREILRQSMWLFKYRGTVQGIKRFVEIYLAREIVLIEHYQVRGLGGAFVGNSETLSSNTVLGAGFRIGGQIGNVDSVSPSAYRHYQDPTSTVDTSELDKSQLYVDAIAKSAHRFSLIVPLQLSSEQRSVVQQIVDVHRPVHTLVEICGMDSGMRLGTGLHIGMTSVVGQSSGFGQLQIGESIIGTTDTLGTPQMGMTLGNSKTGLDTRVG